jgi:hypothetical protein
MPRSAARAVPGDHGARARRVQHCLPLPAAFERQRSVRPRSVPCTAHARTTCIHSRLAGTQYHPSYEYR